MTADIRTAARKEAADVFIEPRKNDMLPVDYIAKGSREGFLAGAAWGVARVTPTRERLAEVAMRELNKSTGKLDGYKFSQLRQDIQDRWLAVADAVLQLMQELVEGNDDPTK